MLRGLVDLSGGILHRMLGYLIQIVADAASRLHQVLRGGSIFLHPRRQFIQLPRRLLGLRRDRRLAGHQFLRLLPVRPRQLRLLGRLLVEVFGLALDAPLAVADILDLLANLPDQIVHEGGELLLAHERDPVFSTGYHVVIFPLEGEVVLRFQVIFQHVPRLEGGIGGNLREIPREIQLPSSQIARSFKPRPTHARGGVAIHDQVHRRKRQRFFRHRGITTSLSDLMP